MNYQKFNQAFWDLCDPRRDFSRFAEIKEFSTGMSSPKVAAMLALAASCLDPDEAYLEVGTYRGCSLTSAASGTDNPVIGIDNFCQFDAEGVNKAQLDKTLEKYGKPNIRFVEADFRALPAPDDRVGVYYYDGAHDTESTLAGLEWVLPAMSKTGIIILDDYSLHGCDRGALEFQIRNPMWRIMLAVKNTSLRDMATAADWKTVAGSDWWTGFCVLYNAN